MLKTRRILLVLALVAGLGSCGDEEGPARRAAPKSASAEKRQVERVAQRYLDALADGDLDAICDTLSVEARTEVLADSPPGTDCPEAAKDSFTAVGLRVQILSIRLDGARAFALVNSADVSDSGNDEVGLQLEDGRWKVFAP